jgi:hypothetical protein
MVPSAVSASAARTRMRPESDRFRSSRMVGFTRLEPIRATDESRGLAEQNAGVLARYRDDHALSVGGCYG